jgi:hypothetical protein
VPDYMPDVALGHPSVNLFVFEQFMYIRFSLREPREKWEFL